MDGLGLDLPVTARTVGYTYMDGLGLDLSVTAEQLGCIHMDRLGLDLPVTAGTVVLYTDRWTRARPTCNG